MSPHSPLPWSNRRAALSVDGAFDFAICDANMQVIAEAFGRTSPTNWPNAEANADLILAACNQHDSLLAQRDALLVALSAAGGYLRNAQIDLATGAKKATALRTIEGGLMVIDAALARAEAT